MAKKRDKYANVACLRCRGKKLRCVNQSNNIGVPPQCERCNKAGVKCVYPPQKPTPKKRKSDVFSPMARTKSASGEPHTKRMRLSIQTASQRRRNGGGDDHYSQGTSTSRKDASPPDAMEQTISPLFSSREGSNYYGNNTGIMPGRSVFTQPQAAAILTIQQQSALLSAFFPHSAAMWNTASQQIADCPTPGQVPFHTTHSAQAFVPPLALQRQSFTDGDSDANFSSSHASHVVNSNVPEDNTFPQCNSTTAAEARHGKSNDFSSSNIHYQQNKSRNRYAMELEKMNSTDFLPGTDVTFTTPTVQQQQSPAALFPSSAHNPSHEFNSNDEDSARILPSPMTMSPFHLGDNLWSLINDHSSSEHEGTLQHAGDSCGFTAGRESEIPSLRALPSFHHMHPVSQNMCCELDSTLQTLRNGEREQITKELIQILSNIVQTVDG
mmetsp:Transcript_11674/g.43892  ORF Transcript_11674/g.43892 Transcript_11674/m.43892 type:complete len:439 (-) Transcript_11674:522-1838(-)|eukprot:CAMPEP_0117442034 /NCGR_PEP_ID=MMETSP0759-20121206/3940_1 /TAXON_ID=63605 /ORGANISM="Percolomonas cosmopolitus, Strain WS" /LENGTH=438 /DNA_ID=CAMNT_0005233903 /DNA_START=3291 /DNA_END=4607 /DNA_ORIENTATION=-